MKKIRLFLWICVALAGVFAAVMMSVSSKPSSVKGADLKLTQGASPLKAVVGPTRDLGGVPLGGPFRLQDQRGHWRTDAEFKGKIMLVYFGYSFCPDICPAALYNITLALDQLGKDASKIQPIFITIDPARDTVAHLKVYATNYHPSLVALTGPDALVKDVAKAYKVYAVKATPDGTAADYLMDHSSIVYVMDRQGRFLTSMNHETDPEDMVRVLKAYL